MNGSKIKIQASGGALSRNILYLKQLGARARIPTIQHFLKPGAQAINGRGRPNLLMQIKSGRARALYSNNCRSGRSQLT